MFTFAGCHEIYLTTTRTKSPGVGSSNTEQHHLCDVAEIEADSPSIGSPIFANLVPNQVRLVSKSPRPRAPLIRRATMRSAPTDNNGQFQPGGLQLATPRFHRLTKYRSEIIGGVRERTLPVRFMKRQGGSARTVEKTWPVNSRRRSSPALIRPVYRQLDATVNKAKFAPLER